MRVYQLGVLAVLVGCGPDTAAPEDNDGDGYDETRGDCNDADASVFPGAPEHCDGRDEDCDGEVDEDPIDPVQAYLDADGDGAIGATSVTACTIGADQSATPGDDCDDTDPGVNPGATEVCNSGIDENCDGTPDDCVRTGAMDPQDSDVRLLGSGDYQWGASIAAVGDVDGDGGAELAVGLSTAPLGSGALGGVYFLPIAEDGTIRQVSASGSVEGIDPWAVPAYQLAAGDVDGDGSADLLVGSPGQWSEARPVASAQLYLGPLEGDRDADAHDLFVAGTDEDGMGTSVVMIPDADGDGLADFAVGAPWTGYDTRPGNDPGHVYLWFSRASDEWPAEGDPDLVIDGYNAGSHFGQILTALPDANGDGYGDLAATAFYDVSGGGVTYILTALAPGSVDAVDAYGTIASTDYAGACGRSVAAWGRGIAIGCPDSSALWRVPEAYLRGYTVLQESGLVPTGSPGSAGGEFPAGIASGDLDHDGEADLLITEFAVGVAWVLYGSGETLELVSDWGKESALGWSLLATDGDGDGFDDAWLADPSMDTVWGVRGRGL